MNRKRKQRLLFAAAFAILFAIECYIALYVRDAFIRPYVGDILVVVLLYCLIRVVVPWGIKGLPLYVFLFAAGVELLQYFHLTELLSLDQYKLVRIVLGATFDFKDIICYGVGALLIWFMELLVKRNLMSSGSGT